MLPLERVEVLARMFAARLQGSNQRQIKLFFAGQELRGGDRRFHLRQPKRAALLQSLDRDQLPFRGFLSRFLRVHSCNDSLGEQGNDPVRAQLGRLLND